MLQTVIPTLCGGFLKTLEIFAVTLLGALPPYSAKSPYKNDRLDSARHAAYAPAFNNILRPRNFV